jgi:hypothetical protein
MKNNGFESMFRLKRAYNATLMVSNELSTSDSMVVYVRRTEEQRGGGGGTNGWMLQLRQAVWE